MDYELEMLLQSLNHNRNGLQKEYTHYEDDWYEYTIENEDEAIKHSNLLFLYLVKYYDKIELTINKHNEDGKGSFNVTFHGTDSNGSIGEVTFSGLWPNSEYGIYQVGFSQSFAKYYE